MELATDPGLTAALRARGYQMRGPVGVGASGPAWAASDAAGERVVVTVLDLDRTLAERRAALARIERLRGIDHPHLARLVDVVALDGHRTALVVAAVEGPTLGAVLRVRPRWPAGEVVTLVVPLADALGALHEAGLGHGDVAPENVVLGPGGRPVLVDLAGAVLPGSGTRGFAPPGRERGPAADVFALARLGLMALLGPGTSPGPGDGAVPGAAHGALVAALGAGCASAPAARPSPAELASRCFDAAPAVPVQLPDAAVLARAALSRMTEGQPLDGTLPDPRVLRRRAFLGRAAGAVASVGLVLALIVALPRAGGTVVSGAPASGSALTSMPRAGSGPETESTEPATLPGADAPSREELVPDADSTVATQAVAAAVSLTELRAAVLSSRDPARLAELTVPGSAAHTADEALMDSLADRVDGLEVLVEVDEARWLASREGSELVLVSASHRESGGAAAPPPEPRTVVLALSRTDAGWRVVDVLDPVAVPELSAQAGPFAG